MRKFRSNNNVVFSCSFHVVWVTKYKKKYLGGDIEKRLKEICLQVADELTFEIKEMECKGGSRYITPMSYLTPWCVSQRSACSKIEITTLFEGFMAILWLVYRY